MVRVAVIGAGISGLSIASMLGQKASVVLYEADSRPGGLVKCSSVDGVLYHRVGGHVFNSRRQDVLDWFWQFFDREKCFTKAVRHAVVALPQSGFVDYPIENHLYQMPERLQEAVLDDLLNIVTKGYNKAENFDDFLRARFGDTLYRCYFAPYNRKIWRRPLTDVPLAWLEGKLPMPTVKEILQANISQTKEMNMVHSSFWYPQNGGSQFLADTLAKNLDVRYNSPVEHIEYKGEKWLVDGELYDYVIYTGNVQRIPTLLENQVNLALYTEEIAQLEYHGTTSVLCEIDANPYSWIYMPDEAHSSHRIICTGNFSPNNDAAVEGKTTATIEFSEPMSRQQIEEQLARIPLAPRYLAHHYEAYTYPLQTLATKPLIAALKKELEPKHFYLLGRFAEWEYYNMDAAIGAALDLNERIQL